MGNNHNGCLSGVLRAIYLLASLYRGKIAGANPWGGLSFEWETSSPPPPENFVKDPVLQHGPYDFDQVLVQPTYPDHQPAPTTSRPAADSTHS